MLKLPKHCLVRPRDNTTYRQRITHFTEELDLLSEDDKDWNVGRAIVTRLGWVISAAAN